MKPSDYDTPHQKVLDKIIGKKASLHLNPKHQLFVDEYLIDLNPARAYQAAGYKSKKPNGGYQAAWALLQRKDVQRAVQKAMEERQRRCHIDQDRVLNELAKIAFSNIKQIARWNESGFTIRNSDHIQDDDAAAISEIQVDFNDFGVRTRVKLYDKRAALVDIGNHLGIFDRKEKAKDPVEEAQKICQLVREMAGTMGSSPATVG
jgi:phage terminase small subunit